MVKLEDILAKKMQRDKDKDKPVIIRINSLGMDLEFTRPKQTALLKAISKSQECEDLEESDYVEAEFIYNHFPYSKQLATDKEYMQDNNINSEIDVIRTLFTITDRRKIVNELMAAGGMGDLNQTVKN